MSDQDTSGKRFQDRVVRIFVSSTFRDMYDEREELVKFTFPELRKRCRERQVEFVEVDLRWGVTDEKKQKAKSCRYASKRSSAAGLTSSACWANDTAGCRKQYLKN